MRELTPTALITGGSRGIGQAVAMQLVDAGWQVISVSRSGLGKNEAVKNIKHIVADVSVEKEVKSLFKQLTDQGVQLTALINNAAVQGGKPIEQQSLLEWQQIINLNLTAVWLMIKNALPLMQLGASIINIGSVAAVAGFANRAAYCASKHALLGLTKALACELAPRKIRVNHLCLGTFETPGLAGLASSNNRTIESYSSRQLLQRLGQPFEAADACVFLASDKASFITGSSMTIDGGLLAKGAFG